MLVWPDSVKVLFPKDKIDEKDYGASDSLVPNSAHALAEDEFRQPYPGYDDKTQVPSFHSATMMIGIWLDKYNIIKTWRCRYPITYSLHDCYNAAWIACGYDDGNWSKAIELERRAIGLRR